MSKIFSTFVAANQIFISLGLIYDKWLPHQWKSFVQILCRFLSLRTIASTRLKRNLLIFNTCGADETRKLRSYSVIIVPVRAKNSRSLSPSHKKDTLLDVFLRCGRDSNSRPTAWQAGILTNWTTAPDSCSFSKAGAKVLLFFGLCKYFSDFFSKKCILPIFWIQKEGRNAFLGG